MNRDRTDDRSCHLWSVGMVGSSSHQTSVPRENGRGYMFMRSRKVTTDWLNVEVTIDEDGLFGLVITNLPQYKRGKLQALALHYMGTKLNGLGLDTILFQLRFQERRHSNDIITASRITRYACVNGH
jgi:hypothetical protein